MKQIWHWLAGRDSWRAVWPMFRWCDCKGDCPRRTTGHRTDYSNARQQAEAMGGVVVFDPEN